MYDSALFSNLSLPQNERTLIKDDIKKKEGGFTIVEVMIVLAIAGLILAIVFIAVPALQRNSRNTQRRADLGNLRAQVETWTSNNGGKIPETEEHVLSITGSTGWGHYNGNDDEPGVSRFTSLTAMAGALAETAAGETRPTGKATADLGNVAEYMIVYSKNIDPDATIALPGRQEIHIWGEMACGAEVLADGNDKDTTGTTDSKYAVADIVESNARAIAYVYQIEGEDNARCEHNVN